MPFSLFVERDPSSALPDSKWIVEATRWTGAGLDFMPQSEYKLLGIGAEDESGLTLTAEYEALFGSPPLGSKLFLRSRVIKSSNGNEGLASSWVYTAAIVEAP